MAHRPAPPISPALAVTAIAAQAVFVTSWLVAQVWRGPGFDPLARSISDLYAVGTPGGQALTAVFAACGVATIVFAAGVVWPALRAAGAPAAIGAALLGLSAVGLGRLLSPFGHAVDAVAVPAGIVLLALAGVFLAEAMRRADAWREWAWPTRWASGLIVFLLLIDGGAQHSGLGGLVERIVACACACAVAGLALGMLRRR